VSRVTTPGLTILAVDDEPRALADLTRLLSATPGIETVATAGDGEEALRRVAEEPFDAVFLDVRMPGLDGLALGRVLRRFADPPQLVFVSAHDEPAVEAFELRALDYLRKPVARRRLGEAVARVLAASEAPAGGEAAGAGAAGGEASGLPDDVVAVPAGRGGSTRLLERDEIWFAASYGDFVRIVTVDSRYLLRSTLGEFERRWTRFGFVRVHRQYVANLHRAVELRPQLGGTAELAFPGGVTVPVARRHAAELARRLGV
jgi:two-component system, LytTR family, response regulator LytT